MKVLQGYAVLRYIKFRAEELRALTKGYIAEMTHLIYFTIFAIPRTIFRGCHTIILIKILHRAHEFLLPYYLSLLRL